MHPDAVVQSDVDARGGLIDVTPTGGDQPHGQLAQLRFGAAQRRQRDEPGPRSTHSPLMPLTKTSVTDASATRAASSPNSEKSPSRVEAREASSGADGAIGSSAVTRATPAPGRRATKRGTGSGTAVVDGSAAGSCIRRH